MEVTITTSREGLDPVCAVLDGIGFDQVTVLEDPDTVRRDLESVAPYWDEADYAKMAAEDGGPGIRLYLADGEEGLAGLERIRQAVIRLRETDIGLDPGPLEVTTRTVGDEQWHEIWKRYFRPVPVGKRLLIQPAWEDVPAEWAGRIPILLSNSGIFGTGQHASTQLCMELLEDAVRPGDRVLDLGCGSGVLFLAALQLGAGHAIAVDVDDKAPRIVAEHADLNGIAEDLFAVRVGDAVRDASLSAELAAVPFDLVLANIVADVLLALTPRVPSWIRPGGRYLLSGIIEGREAEVTGRLEACGFRVDAAARREDWVALRTVYRPDRA